MKNHLALAVSLLLSASAVVRADNVQITAMDSVATVLTKSVGQKVELHLKSGEKIAGKLESANSANVHLSALAGQEFFDAVISAGDISAVVVRTH